MGFGYSGGLDRVDARELPRTHRPNSRIDRYRNGRLVESRRYGHDGRATVGRHYTNHGNSRRHSDPHDHVWNGGRPGQPLPPIYFD